VPSPRFNSRQMSLIGLPCSTRYKTSACRGVSPRSIGLIGPEPGRKAPAVGDIDRGLTGAGAGSDNSAAGGRYIPLASTRRNALSMISDDELFGMKPIAPASIVSRTVLASSAHDTTTTGN